MSKDQSDKELIDRFRKRLSSIKMTPSEFDRFCSGQPHIVRSIRGHAFEVWFDDLMKRSGYNCEKVGGDTVVDRELNGHSLQLKTPFWNGTKENEEVQYKMHKTHGRERYPDALYRREEFAEFLVAMHPGGGVIICPADRLKTRAEVNPTLKWGEYIADPLPFAWDGKWLNRYELIGVDERRLVFKEPRQSDVLPRLSSLTGYDSFTIIKALLSPENFRVWQQLIVGSVREFHFKSFMEEKGVELQDPDILDTRGRIKVDYIYWYGSKKKWLRIQAKGLTKGLCKGGYVLGCETQCSHGRVPTRLYRRTDFEVLVIVIDPNRIPSATARRIGVNSDDYNYLFVKMSDLPKHPRSDEWGEDHIKSTFSFDVNRVKFNNIEVLTNYDSLKLRSRDTLERWLDNS